MTAPSAAELIDILLEPPVHLLERATSLLAPERWDAGQVESAIDDIDVEVELTGDVEPSAVVAMMRSSDKTKVASRISDIMAKAYEDMDDVAGRLVHDYLVAMDSAWKLAHRSGLPEAEWGVEDWLSPLARKEPWQEGFDNAVLRHALMVAMRHLGDATEWAPVLRACGLEDLSVWRDAWKASSPDVASRWFAATMAPELKTKASASTQLQDDKDLIDWTLKAAAEPDVHPALPEVRAWLGDRLPNPSLPQTWTTAIDVATRLPDDKAWRPFVSTVERLGWQDWAGLGVDCAAGNWKLPFAGPPRNAGECINYVRATLNVGHKPFWLGTVIACWRENGHHASAAALYESARAWALPEASSRAPRPRI